MLLDYYNLREQPFGVTPDPRYLYLSSTHREALASLAYGIQSGRGFMSLIATPGMGKTTILFHLLQHFEGRARVAFLCQTLCRTEEILRAVARDLGITDDGANAAELERRLNEVLLSDAREGRKVFVVIDEAQNLEDEALETVRLLSNFETSSDKLLQIVLSGQPQLDKRLSSPRLLQLRQRMSTFARLEPLNPAETLEYLRHRLSVAGYSSSIPLFAPESENLIARYSRGIPRNINNICFNALSLGWVEKQRTIEKDVIREVLTDLGLQPLRNFGHRLGSIRSYFSSKKGNASSPSSTVAFRNRSFVSALILMPLLGIFGWMTLPSKLPPKAAAPAVSTTKTEDADATRANAGSSAKEASDTRPTAAKVQASLPPAGATASRNRKVAGPETNDPAFLWKEVGLQSKAAEVELALMYMAGTSVPRNCAQAQVLLQAAAKRGSRRATELLNGSAAQCE